MLDFSSYHVITDCASNSKGHFKPKRKLGVTTHLLEIIAQQYFYKTLKYKAMYGFLHAISVHVIDTSMPSLFVSDIPSSPDISNNMSRHMWDIQCSFESTNVTLKRTKDKRKEK